MNITVAQKKLNALLSQDATDIVTIQTQKLYRLLKQTGESFVLFGAGRLGQIALSGLRKAGIKPLAFADNSPKLWGQNIAGIEIVSPHDAKQRYGRTAIFVITVYTSSPVRLQLSDLGLNFISFAELAWNYPDALLPHCAVDLPDSIFEQSNEVRQALEVWADDASRHEYLAQLTWQVSLDTSVLPVPINPQEMYFQSDLFTLLPSDTLVDCGAFDGDTIRELLSKKITYERLIAIEPDPINFHNLEKYVSGLSNGWQDKISLHQNAVGSSREKVHFNATGTASSTVDFGFCEVESIPLDEILADEIPTYIKMDIEGAEHEALIGCKQTIERYRPILAICLYHRQDDLWRIPLLIQSISNQYRMFLRRYSDECWEQVCYAIPEERVAV